MKRVLSYWPTCGDPYPSAGGTRRKGAPFLPNGFAKRPAIPLLPFFDKRVVDVLNERITRG